MADKSTPAAAESAAADAPAEEKKRTRKPTAFGQTIRLSLFGHKAIRSNLPTAKAFGDAIVAAGILAGPNAEEPYATRVVTRTRKGSKSSVHSVSIYVANNGFEFTEANTGVRIATDTWDQLRPQLEALGLTADEEGLKKLAAILAANAPTPAAES